MPYSDPIKRKEYHNRYHREWVKRQRGKDTEWSKYRKEYMTEYLKMYRGLVRDNPKQKLKNLLSAIKSRAKQRGLEFNLTLEDVEDYPKVCPVLGIPIEIYPERNSPNALSIDRFDNSKGYTKDNIRLISLRANGLKKDATLEELEKIVAYMKNEKAPEIIKSD